MLKPCGQVEPSSNLLSGLILKSSRSMQASTLRDSELGIKFGGVLEHVSDGVSCSLDSGVSMRPPSLLVGFRESEPPGEPDENVVVQRAALLELGNPDIAEDVAAPLDP